VTKITDARRFSPYLNDIYADGVDKKISPPIGNQENTMAESPYIEEISADQFGLKVLGEERVVVDFYSTECPPCENLATKFEPLSELYGQKVKFIKIFRQANRELATSLDVTGSPTLLFFEGGKRVGDKLTGAITRSSIMRNLDAMLPPEEVKEIRSGIRPKLTEAEVLILGGGPAGLTAGIYLAQAHIDTLIVDVALPGGYVATTDKVSNYPGFIQAMPGYQLSHQMTEQAKVNGVKFRAAVEIDEVDLDNKTVLVDGFETIRAKKIIIATGSQPKSMGVPGERDYRGSGISYCATCDAKYYDGKDVIVLGGGNSAVEESLLIAKFARTVTIIHRSSQLRANKEAQYRASAQKNIRFLLDAEVLEIKKYAPYEMGVVVKDKKSGDIRELPTHGVFIFIGFTPNVGLFGDSLKLDQWGYIDADSRMRTNLPGVFSAGDVNAKHYRQITTAVADGTIAAIEVTKELE
jgi:thioredoxin reductase (NADPH)